LPRFFIVGEVRESHVMPAQEAPVLAAEVFIQLEMAAGCRLVDEARTAIETGICRAEFVRLVELDRTTVGRADWEDIELHARELLRVLRKKRGMPNFECALPLFGSEGRAVAALANGNLDSRRLLSTIIALLEMSQRAATTVLKAPPKKRGESKRLDHAILYSHLARALSTSRGWSDGRYDAAVVRDFAEALYPHLPESIAPKSPSAFWEGLRASFGKQSFGFAERMPN
jgi:hypothetical protein